MHLVPQRGVVALIVIVLGQALLSAGKWYDLNNKPTKNPRVWGSVVPCTDIAPSNTVPTSVHSLRPGDIKVVAALGDSLTAANGAGSVPGDVLDVLQTYRGLAWSIGGDEDINNVTTLPNILRVFNPNLKGFSSGVGNDQRFLNQAVPGAIAADIPSQVEKLIELLKNTSGINFQDDWKLITLFIGANDVCSYCEDQIKHSPERYINYIQTALDMLHKEVPRAFVNLVEILYIEPLRKLHEDENKCPKQLMSILCGCIVDPTNPDDLAVVTKANRAYQDYNKQLVATQRYDTTEDFTVVLQPFFHDVTMPVTEGGLADETYFAPDCFHFSEKAHAMSAKALWNGMLEPVGSKSTFQDFAANITINCPSVAQPYLRTYKNSNYSYPAVPSIPPPPPEPTSPPKPNYGSEITCKDTSPSTSVPKSVHALRPADIKVIGAVGDSLTAGNGAGADNLLEVIIQYRGLTWSVGGKDDISKVTTLPNILRHFNTNLTGFSTGIGDENHPQSFLNQGVPGAKADDMPKQIRKLVDIMKKDKKIDFNNDWKVITLFIGGNDLCGYCSNKPYHSADNYITYISEALDILHAEVPRAFVNLMEMLYIEPLRGLYNDEDNDCPRIILRELCDCVVDLSDGSSELDYLITLNRAYQQRQQELIESGRYDTRDDFTVVLQPFLRNLTMPINSQGKPDSSFFSPDCFHFGEKAHALSAKALWNNMLEPVGKKTIDQDFVADLPIRCPTEKEPYLYTYKNSDYSYKKKNWGSDFSCTDTTPSSTVPTSVHTLRPADIKVIAALGDSLTAANGARADYFSNVTSQWRGVSWSVGGDETLNTVTTLANILKKFNPNLYGFSEGIGSKDSPNARFNVAVPGARARNLTGQAQELVTRMSSDNNINFNNDWKLVTIFIGGNDLCQYCLSKGESSADKFVNHISAALDILYEKVPRVFVNLVEMLEIKGLRRLVSSAYGCSKNPRLLCPCFINPGEYSKELEEMVIVNREYQTKTSNLIASGKYSNRDDFTVVLQPFFRNTFLPLDELNEPDLSYFSRDCFHFSEKGQAEMAIAVWNNMLEPVGKKQTYNDFTPSRKKLKCPTKDQPYLFTEGPSSKSDGMQLRALGSLTLASCLICLFKSMS
ncbi:LOW QUALITY PROTEIN: phospholipase B1, membrane-associated-like [Lampetra fluviatilis]